MATPMSMQQADSASGHRVHAEHALARPVCSHPEELTAVVPRGRAVCHGDVLADPAALELTSEIDDVYIFSDASYAHHRRMAFLLT